MITKELVAVENPVIFYNVDENGTLKYLSNTKNGVFENIVPLEDMHVIIQRHGNIKTGDEWLLNTLPGSKPIEAKGQALTNQRGSCQGCSEDGCEPFCYAIHGAQQHHNSVLPSVIKNMTLYRMDPSRFETEIDAALCAWKNDEKVFRWHASGEIEDYAYLEMMMRIAKKHPEVHFYSYTKRFAFVEKYLDTHGDFPSNFVMNLSVWGDNLVEAGFNMNYLNKVQCFEWKDDISVEEYYSGIHCQSVIHDGKKKGHLDHEMNCKICTLCWKGKCLGKTIIVFNH